MLWIIFAVMSAAAILALLWPLAHKPRERRGGSDIAVYQDQLEEIGRDRSAGLIGEAEAEAARIEVSRRLLAAADAQQQPDPAQPLWHRRAAAIATLIVLSFVPVGLYAEFGSPDIPDAPAYARTGLPPDHEAIMAMVAQVEQHLAQDPNDGAGWQVIAPVYMQLGRFDEAVIAFRKSLALNGETAARDSALGEALVAAANGMVTDEAKRAFEGAIARDPNEVRARYFLGLAAEQDGNKEAAATQWRALLKGAPANAPWAGFVRQALARVTAAPVAAAGPTPQQMQAPQKMPAAQRIALIRGMVAKLAGELHANGGNLDGWLRLVRAYAVLGEPDKAKGAAADAKRALAAHPHEVKEIDDLVKGLGLEG